MALESVWEGKYTVLERMRLGCTIHRPTMAQESGESSEGASQAFDRYICTNIYL